VPEVPHTDPRWHYIAHPDTKATKPVSNEFPDDGLTHVIVMGHEMDKAA